MLGLCWENQGGHPILPKGNVVRPGKHPTLTAGESKAHRGAPGIGHQMYLGAQPASGASRIFTLAPFAHRRPAGEPGQWWNQP